MNAYELADEVKGWGDDLLALNMKGGIYVNEAAVMLRQQADRIAELENIVCRFMEDWTDEFKNYENDSDEPEENKLRDDVFAILRKAQEK